MKIKRLAVEEKDHRQRIVYIHPRYELQSAIKRFQAFQAFKAGWAKIRIKLLFNVARDDGFDDVPKLGNRRSRDYSGMNSRVHSQSAH